MSTSRRQTIKEVRWTERRMREKQSEPFPMSFADAMREYPRLYLLHHHGRELPEGEPFFPPHCERLLDLCHAAETRKSYRNAARLAVRFLDAFIDYADRQAAKGAGES